MPDPISETSRPAGRPQEAIDPGKAYRILEGGPVVLVTTAAHGRRNVMTMGFHMVMQHEPPLLGCTIGPWAYSHVALEETGECVIAVPTIDLARTVVGIGNCSGETVDKFARFGLTPGTGEIVEPPLIAECLANLECRVIDRTLSARYHLHVLEVVAISLDRQRRERRTLHHQGDGTFTTDGATHDLRAEMVRWKQFQGPL